MKYSEMNDTQLFTLALNKAGYDTEPTESGLVECFMDYVDCGQFPNVDIENEIGYYNDEQITPREMAINLIHC